jgi:hypothetical protein
MGMLRIARHKHLTPPTVSTGMACPSVRQRHHRERVPAKPLSWPQDPPTIATVSDRAGTLQPKRGTVNITA